MEYQDIITIVDKINMNGENAALITTPITLKAGVKILPTIPPIEANIGETESKILVNIFPIGPNISLI